MGKIEKHKNIVRAHYVQNISDRPYIFLEYVPGDKTYGSDLTGWIWNNRLDLNTSILCHPILPWHGTCREEIS